MFPLDDIIGSLTQNVIKFNSFPNLAKLNLTEVVDLRILGIV